MGKISRRGAKKALSNYYSNVNITIVNSLSDLEALVLRNPDLVFLGMTYLPVHAELGWQDSEKIWLNNYLDNHGISYTGSGQVASALERNKDQAKQVVLDAGLMTSPFFVAEQSSTLHEDDISLTYPLFVKPTNRGGGLGIDGNSVVHTFEQLETKVNAVKTELGSDSMIEEYLPGREFSVAILRQEATNMFSAMPLELIAPADVNGVRILSGEIKSQDTERFVEVADANIKSIISDLALDVFHALGARDYGRIDIRLDDKGGAHFLEANLLPSLMDGYGNFPKACWLNKQISYDEMLLTIVRMAMPQNEIESKLEHSVFAVNY
jgi:D-alanine-D-alanine ligase